MWQQLSRARGQTHGPRRFGPFFRRLFPLQGEAKPGFFLLLFFLLLLSLLRNYLNSSVVLVLTLLNSNPLVVWRMQSSIYIHKTIFKWTFNDVLKRKSAFSSISIHIIINIIALMARLGFFRATDLSCVTLGTCVLLSALVWMWAKAQGSRNELRGKCESVSKHIITSLPSDPCSTICTPCTPCTSALAAVLLELPSLDKSRAELGE